MELEDICEQLDKTVLEIFQSLEDLYTQKAKLEQMMKDGFFGISRARYSIGVKRISSDQFVDADIKAIRTVLVDEESVKQRKDAKDRVDEDYSVSAIYKLCENVETRKEKSVLLEAGSEPCNVPESNSEGIRQRKNVNQSENREKASKSQQESKENVATTVLPDDKKSNTEKTDPDVEPIEHSSRKCFNPISLFGVLVPQSLKSSQKCFEEAVRISVDIAESQHQLITLQGQMKALRRKKYELSSEYSSAEA